MKNIYKSIGVMALCGLLFTSCNNEDDNTGASSINYTGRTVTLSSSENNVVIHENDIVDDGYSITVTATITEVAPIDIKIPLVQTGGTADSNDFSAGTITIVAGSLSGSASVDVSATGNVEGNETLSVGPANRIENANVNSFTLNITIDDDYINDVLDLTLSWDGSYSEGDITIDSFCAIDLDLILFDSTGTLIDYIAGTSACPESGTISGLADGTYLIIVDLYDNPYEDFGFTAPIPVSLTYSQEYFIGETTFSYSGGYTLGTPSDTTGANFLLLATLEVANGYEYTVTPN